MFSVRVMVRARVTLRVEVMVTVGFRISGTVKTRTTGLTMHTIVNDNQFSHTTARAHTVHTELTTLYDATHDEGVPTCYSCIH